MIGKVMKLLTALFIFTLSFQCMAGVEYRQFKHPEQEQIYKTLIQELRCLVCQNQNIADSNAALAKDLRRQVFEMLQQGKTEQEIVDFMTRRYGDFVMYRPPFKAKTGLLWLGPVIFLFIGVLMLFLLGRRRKMLKTSQLSADKKAEISKLLEPGDRS